MLSPRIYSILMPIFLTVSATLYGQGGRVETAKALRHYQTSQNGHAWAAFQCAQPEEFLVNDDSLGGCKQILPVVATDGTGCFVMAWSDQRNGRKGNWGESYYYRGWDVYFQRFDPDGNPLGPNQKVNDDTGNLTRDFQNPVSIAMNPSGRFAIVWEDMRPNPELKQDIFFQLFDSQGNAMGPNRKANEDDGVESQGYPAVVMDEQGGFIIVWQNMNESYSDLKILFRRFDANGNPIGSNQKVNDDLGQIWAAMGGPSVSMDGSGRFAITWIGQIQGGYDPDILFQRFDASGNPLGSNQTANDDTAHAEQASPSIGMNERGDIHIAWEDSRNNLGGDIDYYDIYSQRFNFSGQAVGANQMANDDTGWAGQYHPTVAIGDAGTVTVAWHDNRTERSVFDVYYQQYDGEGQAHGVNKKTDTVSETSSQTFPHIAMDDDGRFILVWEDDREGEMNQDVWIQRFDSDGGVREVARKANDDIGSTDQTVPAVAMDGKGGFIVAWTDERNAFQIPHATYDIYFQQYDATGIPVGPNRKVNDSAGRISDPTTPSVAADSSGNFVISWQDNRVHSWDIYCQRYDASGQPLGPNELVSDDNNYDADQRSPSMAMNSRGDYVIAWTHNQGFDSGIRFQLFDADGHRVGGIREPYYHSGGDWPVASMDESGRFAIAWYISAYYYIDGVTTIVSDVYVERFDAEGKSLGRSRKANDVPQGQRGGPSLAMNRSGEFTVAWQDQRNGNKDVYCQRYDSNGNEVGANQQVNNDAGIAAPYSPAVVIDETGRFLIAWADERLEARSAVLFGQSFHANGSKDGENFVVTPDFCSRFPVAASNSEKILFAWQDNRREKGFDIYVKLITWEKATVISEKGTLPSRHALLLNYPNPFNPQTTILYHLSAPGRVKMCIVNLTGRNVCDLCDVQQDAGFYQVRWNGTDERGAKVDSGIYFCRMSVKSDDRIFQTTMKLCLVR